MLAGFNLVEMEIVFEQEQELLLHQVDLDDIEENGVVAPVLVLWRRVIEVLGSNDKSGEKHAMTSARHAYGNGIINDTTTTMIRSTYPSPWRAASRADAGGK